MSAPTSRSPVVLLAFNRPATTARVLERIRAARPPRLFFVTDGPRKGRPGEAEVCAQVRALVEKVDWPCDVRTDFSPTNLGCRDRISSGLSWVFSQVEEAIILEDDCLPDPSFFPFADELLERYRDDRRVFAVSGDQFLGELRRPDSYSFSRYVHVWGWATWRRSWERYDVSASRWPQVKHERLLERLYPRSPRMARFWSRLFDRVATGALDTWDFQLQLAAFVEGGLCVAPRVNLVENIGNAPGTAGTHLQPWYAGLPSRSLSFPLVHPAFVVADGLRDEEEEAWLYRGGGVRAASRRALRWGLNRIRNRLPPGLR